MWMCRLSKQDYCHWQRCAFSAFLSWPETCWRARLDLILSYTNTPAHWRLHPDTLRPRVFPHSLYLSVFLSSLGECLSVPGIIFALPPLKEEEEWLPEQNAMYLKVTANQWLEVISISLHQESISRLTRLPTYKCNVRATDPWDAFVHLVNMKNSVSCFHWTTGHCFSEGPEDSCVLYCKAQSRDTSSRDTTQFQN